MNRGNRRVSACAGCAPPAGSAVMEDISENIPEHIVHIAAFKMILLISALRAAV